MNDLRLADLDQRLRRLERQRRRLRLALLALLAMSGTLLLPGAKFPSLKAKQVQAKLFVLQPQKGNDRGSLGLVAGNPLGLHLGDADGCVVAALEVTPAVPRLELMARQGDVTARLRAGAWEKDEMPVVNLELTDSRTGLRYEAPPQ